MQRYLLAVISALATAILAYVLALVTEHDSTRAYRTFFKTLVSGLLAGGALAWLTGPRADPVATLPFDTAFA